MYIFLTFISLAFGKSLAGVTLPDTAVVEGSTLQLNGMGLREKYWIDIYVAGLYVTSTSQESDKLISSDTPKRLHTHFIYSKVPKQKMIETLKENIKNNPEIKPETLQEIDKAALWMEDFTTGDELIFDYIPGTGTIFKIKGEVKGIIPGKEFMQALFSIYVGNHPASEQLKNGLLGYE